MRTIFITGGAGFIGSAVVRRAVRSQKYRVVTVDKLTYAGSKENLREIAGHPHHHFEQIDICDFKKIQELFIQYKPDAVLHLAAESHVDRSIDGPGTFIETNVVGTFRLLECARGYWRDLPEPKRSQFRFQHISTDEVFGSLGDTGYFTEETPYQPNSPYSASKASSDHLVRAWRETYGLPTVLTNCSNNYGPYHFPEKLIPLMILNALEGKALPVYGKGDNVRDWLFVEDHAEALMLVLEKAETGESYNVGGNCEMRNIDVVYSICELVDELAPNKLAKPRRELVQFVTDRPGHDHRYAIDTTKIKRHLGWQPRETFKSGLRKTVEWYLNNREWCLKVQEAYQRQRLGKLT